MKRFVSICMCLALAVTLFIPASAAETSGNSFNVLDYVSVNNGNSNFFGFKGSTTVSFNIEPLLGRMRCYWFDIVYVVTRSNCTLDSITSGVHSVSVTESYSGATGNRTSHASGTFGGLALGSFDLHFSNDGSADSYVTILSFNIHTMDFNRINIPATLKATPGNMTTISPGGSGSVQSQPITGTTLNPTFSLLISPSYWHDVDYIDVSFYVSCLSLNSITCATADDVFVPVESSVILSGDSSSNSQHNDYYLTCRLDLTDLDRSLNSNIQLLVTVTSPDSDSCLMTVTGLSGCIVSAPINAELKWYQILWNTIKNGFVSVGNWLSSGFDSVVQTIKETMGVTVPDQQKENIKQETDQIDDIVTDMQEVMPTIPDLDLEQNTVDYMLPVGGAEIVSNIFGLCWEFPNINTYVSILAVFALGSYVLFGKWA